MAEPVFKRFIWATSRSDALRKAALALDVDGAQLEVDLYSPAPDKFNVYDAAGVLKGTVWALSKTLAKIMAAAKFGANMVVNRDFPAADAYAVYLKGTFTTPGETEPRPPEPRPPEPPPPPPPTALVTYKLDSTPQGAGVVADGVFRGNTPVTFTSDKQSMRLAFILAGYDDFTVSGGAPAGGTFSYTAVMVKAAPQISFTTPAWLSGVLTTNYDFDVGGGYHIKVEITKAGADFEWGEDIISIQKDGVEKIRIRVIPGTWQYVVGSTMIHALDINTMTSDEGSYTISSYDGTRTTVIDRASGWHMLNFAISFDAPNPYSEPIYARVTSQEGYEDKVLTVCPSCMAAVKPCWESCQICGMPLEHGQGDTAD